MGRTPNGSTILTRTPTLHTGIPWSLAWQTLGNPCRGDGEHLRGSPHLARPSSHCPGDTHLRVPRKTLGRFHSQETRGVFEGLWRLGESQRRCFERPTWGEPPPPTLLLPGDQSHRLLPGDRGGSPRSKIQLSQQGCTPPPSGLRSLVPTLLQPLRCTRARRVGGCRDPERSKVRACAFYLPLTSNELTEAPGL